jgi:hypothetical protein
MESNTDFEHVDSPKNQVIFVFLEHLQDLKNEGKMTEDTLESVEVAMQCLNSSFGVDLNDEDARKKYSIKPHSLPTVLGLGLAGKEKLAQALDKMVITRDKNLFNSSRNNVNLLPLLLMLTTLSTSSSSTSPH